MSSMPDSSMTRIPVSLRTLRYRRYVSVAIACTLATLVAGSEAFAELPITVMNGRIRLLPGDLPLAGYFDVVNRGTRPLILTAVSSPAFKIVRVHRSIEQDEKSMMVPAGNIEISPGATLRFVPGDYHLMLMERVKPLQVGDKVPITLHFEGRQTLQVMFEVKGADVQ